MSESKEPCARVAMVAYQGPPVYGGAGQQAANLATALTRHGVTTTLYTQNHHGVSRCEVVCAGFTIRRSPGEWLLRRLPPRAEQVARTVIFSAWVGLRLLFGSQQVIHVHGSFWHGQVAALVARVRRQPLVVKVTRLGEDDALTVSEKRAGRLPLGWAYSFAHRSADFVVALSEEIRERNLHRFPGVRCEFLPNGVDVARFQEALNDRDATRGDLGVSPETFVVLFSGVLAAHKGVGELLGAWETFAVGRPALLVLVGPGSGFYRDLGDFAANGSVAAGDSVRHVEHVPFAEMASLYAAADLFVLPSRAEGMPNSLLEGLASGLPTLVSSVPGVREVIDVSDPETYVLDEITESSIATCLERAAEAHVSGGRATRLPERYALDTIAKRYASLYGELLGR